MKKALSVVLTLVMFLSAFPLTGVTTLAATSGDWEYKVLDTGTAEITKYNGTATKLAIPSKIGGKTVTSIGDWAFCNCKSLTSITIPDSVTRIGESAFNRCTKLSNVTIPKSVTEIGEDAFSNCTSLKSVTLPDSLTQVSDYTFAFCTSLTSVTLPNSVTSIGGFAFEYCSSLSSIIIPNGVTSIGYEAFYNCTSLASITIPKSVTSVGLYAFFGCSSLQSIQYGGTLAQWVKASPEEDRDRTTVYCQGAPATSVANAAGGAKISWNKVAGAKGYYVYRKTGSGSYSRIATTTSLSYVDKTAKSGTTYTYAVRAYNGRVLSAFTGVKLLRLANTTVKLANTTASVKVSWTKVTGAKGYYVYRKAGSGSYSRIATTTALSYVDKTAKAGTAYTYAVRAYSGNTTGAITAVSIVRLTTPSVTVANTANGPKATWGKVTGAKGYYVYRKTGSGSYSKIATTTSLSYVDKTAKSGTTYTYAVRAYSGSSLSAYTNNAIACKK